MKRERGRPKGVAGKVNKSFGPLGDLLRKHRFEQGLGLADVAKACQYSVQFISNIEHGRAPLPWKMAQQLADVLKIPQNDLQSACFATSSVFKSFSEHSGQKVSKPSALKNLNGIVSTLSVVSSDPSLKEIIERYKIAPASLRKDFIKLALEILSS